MPNITNFTEAQNVLRPYYNNTQTIYSLDVMQALMKHLGDPQNQLKILHVAGTSGKTSTAYYTSALLKASGKSVGLSVSPHVDTINERLQIDGQPLPEAEFCAVLGEFIELVNATDIKPSYFELLAAMAYWEFARRGLDYAVVEVGLGGLLDGTNVVTRADKVCIITDIGLDHTEILGDTLSKIAAQKAGIIHDGNQVFMYQQSDDVMDVVQKVATEHGASLCTLQSDAQLTRADLPEFQQRNLGLAVKAVESTLQRDSGDQLSDAAIDQAASIVVPARLERFTLGNKVVIVDGSHNQQKIQALLKGVRQLYPNQAIATLCAFVKGSDGRWQSGLDELMHSSGHIVFTSFHGEQDVPKSSIDPVRLQEYAMQHNFYESSVELRPHAALAELLARPEPILLITGSFYLLNHIRPVVRELV